MNKLSKELLVKQIIIILMIAFLLVYISLSAISNLLVDNNYEKIAVETELSSEKLNRLILYHESIAMELDQFILRHLTMEEMDDDSYKLNFFNSSSDVMSNLAVKSEEFNNVFMIYIDDRSAYSHDIGGTFINEQFALDGLSLNQDRFIEMIDSKNNEFSWSKPIKLEEEDAPVTLITYSRVLEIDSTTRIILGTSIYLENFFETLSEDKIFESTKYILLDEDKLISFVSDNLSGGNTIGVSVFRDLASDFDSIIDKNLDIYPYIAKIEGVNDNYHIVQLIERNDIRLKVNKMKGFMLWIFAGSIMFIILSSFFVVRTLTKPITDLTKSIKHITYGNEEVELPDEILKSKNEIGMLANSIENLIDKVSMSNEKINYQNNKLKHEIESNKKMIHELSLSSKILESVKEGIIITDDKLNIEYVNNVYCKVTGFSKEELIGKSISDLEPEAYKLWKELKDSVDKFGFWKGQISNHKKDGTKYFQKMTLRMLKESETVTKYYSIYEDVGNITFKHGESNQFDQLTGLLNKDGLRNLLDDKISIDADLTLFLIGIDNFRNINESLGHTQGDMLLKMIAKRLESNNQSNGTVFRIGGDEFGFLLTEDVDKFRLETIASETLISFRNPFEIDDQQIYITSSIGICKLHDEVKTADDMLRCSTSAMNYAKDSGKNNYKFYTEEIIGVAERKLSLSNMIKEGWINNEFFLVYQPKYDFDKGRFYGAETLMRWKNEQLGNVPPSDFIPIAEENGMIVEMGKWAIYQSVNAIKKLEDENINDFIISVNLSYHQLLNDEIVHVLKDAITKAKIKPTNLELEITEGLLMTNTMITSEILNKIKSLGVKISIDDFGTGYSSLNYLHKLPIDIIKIDREFVNNIVSDQGVIAKVIIDLAKNFNLDVIAEGVETKEQIDFLYNNGCKKYQGYYYARPVVFDDMVRKIQSKETAAELKT